MKFSTPFVRVDLDILENNISEMHQKLSENNISHYPHIKVHKSVELANMQLKCGASGITVAKISEAAIMAKSGITNILIANTLVGDDKFQRLEELLHLAQFTVTVDNLIAVEKLGAIAKAKNKKINILIEIKTPVQRGGVDQENAIPIAIAIKKCEFLSFEGVFCYMGIRPNLETDLLREELATDEKNLLLSSATILESNGITVSTLSGGTSLTSKYAHCLKGITQSRAGNYIFNDCNGVYLGYSHYKDCALMVEATVINLVSDDIAIIDAGSKTLTSDTKADLGYGHITEYPNAKIIKLNEEHGFIKMSKDDAPLNIGDKVRIIPFHSCVVPNLCDEIYAFRKNVFEKKIKIDARGCCY